MADEYKLTRRARAELKRIGQYTELQWGVERQRNYLAQLYKRFDQINKSPHLGRERPELAPEVRSVLEGKHIIFYRVGDAGIEIVRVLHQSMDIKRKIDT